MISPSFSDPRSRVLAVTATGRDYPEFGLYPCIQLACPRPETDEDTARAADEAAWERDRARSRLAAAAPAPVRGAPVPPSAPGEHGSPTRVDQTASNRAAAASTSCSAFHGERTLVAS